MTHLPQADEGGRAPENKIVISMYAAMCDAWMTGPIINYVQQLAELRTLQSLPEDLYKAWRSIECAKDFFIAALNDVFNDEVLETLATFLNGDLVSPMGKLSHRYVEDTEKATAMMNNIDFVLDFVEYAGKLTWVLKGDDRVAGNAWTEVARRVGIVRVTYDLCADYYENHADGSPVLPLEQQLENMCSCGRRESLSRHAKTRSLPPISS